jgi:hypothetical protein
VGQGHGFLACGNDFILLSAAQKTLCNIIRAAGRAKRAEPIKDPRRRIE